MRRIARIDDNHTEIADGLRDRGCSVLSLASLGDGVPDLLIGRQGFNFMLEVKNPEQPPSKRKLRASVDPL